MMSQVEHTSLLLVATDIDDETPQVLAAVQERALAEGALDCVLVPLHMKKGRTGIRIEILCQPSDRSRFVLFLLQETTTLGVRVTEVDRYSLPRHFGTVEVMGAKVRVKIASVGGVIIRSAPEFDDCRSLAERNAIPVREVLARARRAADDLFPPGTLLEGE